MGHCPPESTDRSRAQLARRGARPTRGRQEYLTAGDVFTPDLIETWIENKRTEEIAPVQLRPHPHELELYDDI